MNNNVLKLEINNKTKALEKIYQTTMDVEDLFILISLISATFTIIDLENKFHRNYFQNHQNILEIYLIECYLRIF